MQHLYAIIACAMITPVIALARHPQTDTDTLLNHSGRFLRQVTHTSVILQEKIDRRTRRYLRRILQEEQRVSNRFAQTGPNAMTPLPGGGLTDLSSLLRSLPPSDPTPLYIPFLDTLHTSLRYLQQHPQLLAATQGATQQLQKSLSALQSMQDRLQRAEAVKQLLQQRQQYLLEQCQRLGLVKDLKKLGRSIYDYEQQLQEYKSLLNNPQRIQRKAIAWLSHTAAFQDFMKRHSLLASLFRLPGADTGPLDGNTSLQTREQVGSFIRQQIENGGPNAQQWFQEQVQTAQNALSQLRDKLGDAIAGTDTDMAGFRPNTQRTKSFGQRLELGANVQSQQASLYFPVTTDIGLSIGYRFTSRAIAGIGASYTLGWGQGWDQVRITHQGASIRSYVDWQIKNSYWASSGFEMNCRPSLTEHAQRNMPLQTALPLNRWQQSGLIGLSKKYQAGRKLKGRIQLLWDFLSYRQWPRPRPFVFRVGYDLK